MFSYSRPESIDCSEGHHKPFVLNTAGPEVDEASKEVLMKVFKVINRTIYEERVRVRSTDVVS